MTTNTTIGRCNTCGKECHTDAPQVGYLCRETIRTVTPAKDDEPEKVTTRQCGGVVIRVKVEVGE